MRKFVVLTIAIAIPLLVGYFYFMHYNEDKTSWSIQCGFHALTGMQCPGCGGQRAIHYLLHGDILKALRYNVLFIIGLPVLIYMYFILIEVHGFNKVKHFDGFFYSSLFAKIALGTIILFSILRNIPVFPFIYLSPP